MRYINDRKMAGKISDVYTTLIEGDPFITIKERMAEKSGLEYDYVMRRWKIVDVEKFILFKMEYL